MRTFSHCGENFFSKARELFENIATFITLCTIQIATKYFLPYTRN